MPMRTLDLLLVEPQGLIRSTVVAVSRELHLPRIDEASSVNVAAQRLARKRYDGLLLSLDELAPALALLEQLRAGALICTPTLPVIVMAAGCSTETAVRVKQLGVNRLLLKPFKVKTLLESIEALSAQVLEREPA